MSSSATPTTTRLCASCENVDANAPRRSPKPRTKPRPTRPVPRCRSITAIFARSRSGSATRGAVLGVRLLDERLGHDLARDEADHARAAALPGHRKSAARDRPHAHALGAPTPARASPGSPRRPAALEHDLRDEALEVGQQRARRLDSRARSRRACRARARGPDGATPSRARPPVRRRSATASRTSALIWPSPAMCSGSRSSVQNAIRDGPNSATSGTSACRFRAAEASRIRSHMPGAEPLAALVGRERLVVGADARRGVRLEARPSTPGAWPSTWSAPATASFASSLAAPAITPGKFIISARPITRVRRSRLSRSPGVNGRRGDSNPRPARTRRR